MTNSLQQFTITSKTKVELLVLWKEVSVTYTHCVINLKRIRNKAKCLHRILKAFTWTTIDIVRRMI